MRGDPWDVTGIRVMLDYWVNAFNRRFIEIQQTQIQILEMKPFGSSSLQNPLKHRAKISKSTIIYEHFNNCSTLKTTTLTIDRCLAITFIIIVLWVIGAQHNGTKGKVRPLEASPSGLGDPQDFISLFLSASFFLRRSVHAFLQTSNTGDLRQTQVQPLKKGVSNSATQDSIMNAHNKTKFTHAKIKCALKDSSCDSPISKNLILTILASNVSSTSTKVFKYPHTRNDSIFTRKV
ncbi:hypothetical protein H5410_003312 [Solanum commersonii]|uniref:Uncharacterized protein n=1 Tax=Solanum commersonii TaxID=4109 RepID=A0A9J6B4Q2_SOLCO|nr:hypothetical protein H5410_003312 [Solanum commersonii]